MTEREALCLAYRKSRDRQECEHLALMLADLGEEEGHGDSEVWRGVAEYWKKEQEKIREKEIDFLQDKV